MNVSLTHNGRELGSALRRYAEETGKTYSEALAREGPDFKLELFRQFRRLRPATDSIKANAEARGYRMHRRGNFMAPAENGVSRRAVARARDLLGGQKSEYFEWRGGRLQLAKVSLKAGRTGQKRGPGFMRGHSRTGYINSKSGLRVSQLTPEQASAAFERRKNEIAGGSAMDLPRRLNLRAVAVYFETAFRMGAARGGTLALQWLHNTYRRATGKFVPRTNGNLIQRTRTGVPIGEVAFEFGANGLTAINFKGAAPGTVEQDAKHNVTGRVASVRAAGLLNAIRMSHEKALRKAGL